MNKDPAPPDGFQSWLDYAVETFDTRQPYLENLFSEGDSSVTREAIREAARSELLELRQRALAATSPSLEANGEGDIRETVPSEVACTAVTGGTPAARWERKVLTTSDLPEGVRQAIEATEPTSDAARFDWEAQQPDGDTGPPQESSGGVALDIKPGAF